MSSVYPIAWLSFLLIVMILIQKTTKCLNNINIYTYFFYTLLLTHGIFNPLYSEVSYEYAGIKLPPNVIDRWYISLAIMYTVMASFLLLKSRLKPPYIARNRHLIKFKYLQVDNNPGINHKKKIQLGMPKSVLIFMVLIVLFEFWALWKPQLLLESIANELSAEEYGKARASYGNDTSSFDGNFIIRIANTLKFSILPLILYVFYFAKDISRRHNIAFWLTFLVTFLLNIITGQKGGVIMILIGIFICYRIKTDNLFVFDKKVLYVIFFIAILVFGVIPIQYGFQYPTSTYEERIAALMYRMSGETARVLQTHFYVYPELKAHLNGMSSAIVSLFFGDGTILDPARDVVSATVAEGTYDSSATTWNALFIGSAWADFGYVGVTIQSFIVVWLLTKYESWYKQVKKTAFSMGTYVSLIMSSSLLAQSNFLTTLFSFGLLLNFIFFYVLKDKSLDKPVTLLNNHTD
jgi:oligosaccharide repeat unit polymerase